MSEWMPDALDRALAEIERLRELCEVRAEIMEVQEKEIAATIERCAQVAERCYRGEREAKNIAAAIRALKDG